jgi:Rrf2 family iron-sulfur cluster assembly transcriptional regulator
LEYRSSALVFKTFRRPQATAGKIRHEEDAVKLSTKGRYAVMAMVDLARHAQTKPVSLSDIATRQEISLSYLEQLFARLRRAELVKSVRGPGGGYRLARSSSETRVSEIILAVDEPIKATRCTEMGATGCRADRSKCLTHDLWEELGNQIHIFLSSVTLSDVLERKITTRLSEAPPPANSDSMAAAS